MSQHIRHDSRVQNLNYSEGWKHLTEKERNYAYWMAKASWAGAKVVLHQISQESAPLFCIFQTYFRGKNFSELEKHALQAGASKEDWREFLAYAAGFYANLSNYHAFGHMKFVPNMEPDTFLAILKSCPKRNDDALSCQSLVQDIYP